MNSTISEILTSIKENARERIKSPLIGAIFVSWMLLNWKIIAFFALTNKEIEVIIPHIDAMNDQNWPHFFWTPIFAGLAYVLASPYLNYWIQQIRNRPQYKSKKDSLEWEERISHQRHAVKVTELKIKEKDLEIEDRSEQLKEQKIKLNELTGSVDNKTQELEIVNKQIVEANDKLGDITKQIENQEEKVKESIKERDEARQDRDKAIKELDTARRERDKANSELGASSSASSEDDLDPDDPYHPNNLSDN